MSLDATRWAWKQKDLRSSQKIVLLSMADRANENHECRPSISRLEEDTCLDRKTVMKSISELEEMGRISIVKKFGAGNVYLLIGVDSRHEPVPKTVLQPVPETAPVPKVAPVPETGLEPVPKTGLDQYQKRDTESTKNLPMNLEHKKHKKSASADYVFPEQISEQLHKDFLAIRKAKKSPLTQTAVNGLVLEAKKAGLSLQAALEMCCVRGWAGFKAEWLEEKPSQSKQAQKFDPVSYVNQNRKQENEPITINA